MKIFIGVLSHSHTLSQDGSNDLVLDWWTHRSVALMVVEAHSVLLPWLPGGRDYTSVQSSIGKVINNPLSTVILNSIFTGVHSNV